MTTKTFLFLDDAQVERLIPTEDCLAWVEQALAEFSRGQVTAPPRMRLLVPDGRTSFMPSYVPSRDSLTCKIVSFYGKNPDRGLPAVISSLALIDSHSGLLKCIMEATFITAIRTGAIAGIAVKNLMSRKKGTVGVLGSGALARWGLISMAEVMEVERVLVYSRNAANRENYAKDLGHSIGKTIEVSANPDEVASVADVLLCATSAKTPVFHGEVLREGTLVISLGANTPDTREIDEKTVVSSKIIVDSRESALKECGEFIIPIREGLLSPEKVSVEIGQIITGDVPLLPLMEKILLVKSVGISAVDAMVASHVYERALESGIGVRVPGD